MMIEPLVKTLLEAGVHFGHQTHRWNPKMKRFIFGEKNGIYIVDLEKTAQGLTAAKDFLRKVASEGGPILFVGTKPQAQPIIAEEAARCGQFYVNLRWLGGLLTNFQTVRKSIERLKQIRAWRQDGTFERMTKKEQAHAEKDLAKLEKVLGGIIEMPGLPKAVYVIDAKREETAVKEAHRLGIPVVALVDTNCDPDPIHYCIPGNDDAIRSIKLITSVLADAVEEGRQQYLAGLAELERQKAEAAAEAAARAEAEARQMAGAAEGPLGDDEEDEEKIVPEALLKTAVEKAEEEELERRRAAKIKHEQERERREREEKARKQREADEREGKGKPSGREPQRSG